jgi:hypothetical protein
MGVEAMRTAAKEAMKKYRFSEKSLETLEWAHGKRAELHYLHPEKTLIGASERAKKTRDRLWSVVDGQVRYFRLFSHPVSAAKAFRDFLDTPLDEDAEAETFPPLVVPYAFVVEAWDARKVREDEVREEMRKEWYYWSYEDWPFEERFPPKATFLAIAWFIEG